MAIWWLATGIKNNVDGVYDMIDKFQAIVKLVPKAKFMMIGGEITWGDERPQPTEEQIQAKIAELEAAEPLRLMREERNNKLSKTDWRATVDYPGTDQEAWLTYRQSLRDLPATAEPELDENGMLTNVTWPEEPV